MIFTYLNLPGVISGTIGFIKKMIMYTKLLLGTIFIALALPSLAQTPAILWEQEFDGSLSGKDQASSLTMDGQNNIFITGTSFHLTNKGTLTTIKYDPAGNPLWTDHYYATQTGINRGRKINIDEQGTVYATGTIAMNLGDLAIVKYGPNGRIWGKNYEPYYMTSYEDEGVDIGFDSVGNIYTISRVMSIGGNLEDLYMLKCDSSGTKIWDDNYSASSVEDLPVALGVSRSGNAYPVLQAYGVWGSSTYDISTIQYLNNGVKNWFSKYNGPGNGYDYPICIRLDAAENQYVCGTADGGATDDMVATKQNEYGTRLWTVLYNGTANLNDTAVAIQNLSNGLVAVTARCQELHNGFTRDAIVTMVIDSGTVLWTQKYFGADDIGAVPMQMIIDDADNIYITGYENSAGAFKNGTIIKYDSNGNLLWDIQYSGIAGLDDLFNDIKIDSNSDIIVTGQTFTTVTNANYLTVKYSQLTGVEEAEIYSERINIYPNPAHDKFSISGTGITNVTILNGKGQVLRNEKTKPTSAVSFDCGNWSKGMYVVKTITDNATEYHKLILQ
jgi:hypothetical protein